MPLLKSPTNECPAAKLKPANLRRRSTGQLLKNSLSRKYSSNPNFCGENALEPMETVNSLQQPSTSISLLSTSTNNSLKCRKRPLMQKDFLLDLDDHRNRESLKKDIEKLGGRVVETIDDSARIFCLVSDYRYASLLERKNSANKLVNSSLPLLLRDAVESGIRIRSFATFQQSLLNLKNKMKNEKKLENASVKAQQHLHHGGIKRLSSPFMKLEDSSLQYAPLYKEFPSTRYFEPIYLGQLAGKSIFHKVTPEMAERRMREEKEGRKRYPRWKSRLGSGYCDICARNCSNLQLHFTNEEHRRRVSQPSFYDRVDALCGSFTPDIVVPNIPLLERKKSPSPQPLIRKRCWKYDSD